MAFFQVLGRSMVQAGLNNVAAKAAGPSGVVIFEGDALHRMAADVKSRQ